jgi:hypothetical protein
VDWCSFCQLIWGDLLMARKFHFNYEEAVWNMPVAGNDFAALQPTCYIPKIVLPYMNI